MTPKCLIALSLFIVLCHLSAAQQLSGPLKDLAAKIVFSKDYSIHEAPNLYPGRPLLVNFSINLRNVLEVDEKQQLITLETSLRLYWFDPRIAVLPSAIRGSKRYVLFHPNVAEFFWIPDIFIDKAKDVRVPTYFVRPASLRVYNDSSVRYSSRLNFDVACKMEFQHFPVDKQVCEVKFESFGFTTQELQFAWKKGYSNINKNISLAQFDMEVVLEDTYVTDYYELAYPGLIMKILLKREIGYHVVQTYIPSMIFVFVSWLSLFISPESIPGRVGMGMTTLLTLTAMFGAVRNNVPKVSYVSFLDIWMVVCIVFVFFCILEFTIVSYLIKSGRGSIGEKVEARSRIAVPIAFIFFNAVYWYMVYGS